MEYFVWDIEPIAISVGFLKVRWYGLLFATAFTVGYLLMTWIYKREGKNTDDIDDLLWYIAISAIIGARLGHCLFYAPGYYLAHPLKIFAIWEGGLASHGGLIGIIVGLYLFQSKARIKESFVWFLDRVSVVCAIGGSFVRTGNFFNSEIVGVPSTVPWAVVFKKIDLIPRHPAQLYEAISYVFIFFILLHMYRTMQERIRPGVIFASYLVMIFIARFLIEFVKTRQAHYVSDFSLSTGQLLSIPLILAGLSFIVYPLFKKRTLL